MDINQFYVMLNDRNFANLRKMGYKYPEEMDSFLVNIELLYKELGIYDFKGNSLVYIPAKAEIDLKSYKLLLKKQETSYGTAALENEILSTSEIENIDYKRESVRNILKGYAPVDEEEKRILGLKNGFAFISDKKNRITEESIYKLYEMTIGKFLDEENRLKEGYMYRHSSVYIQDLSGKNIHTGMDCRLLSESMKTLISFIDKKDNINELVKAAVIHFYIAYIHPYFDGNGRMARLIHMWYLVQQGFDHTLFIPFSSYILKSKKKYYEAYELIEENNKKTGKVDVTPFIMYFNEFVYGRFETEEAETDTLEKFTELVHEGSVTEKEEKLWEYVISHYGTSDFSTKQLEKDFGNAAYATIRGFVLKFEQNGLLISKKYSNRTKYKVKK